MNRWKYAFVALVALLIGGGGMVVVAMSLPYTMKFKAVYVAASVVGLVALGVSIGLMRGQPASEEEDSE